MKVPLSWLREYVTFDQPVDEVVRSLTLAGIEVAHVERTGSDWDNVYVGEVESVEPHPNADRLVLATVNYGEDRATVVTGAPNIRPGQRVAMALEGAVLVDAYSENRRKKKLKASTIRGVRSAGMVCSDKELGLGDAHEGIRVLAADAPVGVLLSEYLGDYVLDVELTPSQAYANSIIGVAREVAAVTRSMLSLPPDSTPPTGPPGVHVQVEGPHVGTRYMLQRLDNLRVGPSPDLIRARLRACGVRSINNVVDVTNYVMLEYGQPMHPFDADTVQGAVHVRAARPDEELETLDHQVRKMPAGTIMIADEARAIGIGGIIGGLHSEVSETTTSILLESANFEATQIRRSARGLGLRTDASARFERGIDPEVAVTALGRAVELLVEIAGATPVDGPFDWYPGSELPGTLSLDPKEVRRLLGVDIPPADIVVILSSLGFEAEFGHGVVQVIPPSFRRDVTRTADLVEEVGRIWGYDKLPAVLPEGPLPAPGTDVPALLERRAREWLVSAGLQEVINYALTSPEALALLESLRGAGGGPRLWEATENLLKVLNPLSSEREYLRPSLLPGLLQTVRLNLRHAERVWVYELDRVFERAGDDLPQEPKRLGIAVTGLRQPRSPHLGVIQPTSLFDLKGVVEALLRYLRVSPYSLTPSHIGEGASDTLALEVDGKCAGFLFELAQTAAAAADIEARVFVAEIDWGSLVAHSTLDRKFVGFSRFPAVRQDVAVAVPDDVRAADVLAMIRRHGGKTLREAELLEVYTGAPLEEGWKSLLYRLSFVAPDRNLTEDDASRIRRGIEQALRDGPGARIRGVDSQ